MKKIVLTAEKEEWTFVQGQAKYRAKITPNRKKALGIMFMIWQQFDRGEISKPSAPDSATLEMRLDEEE